MIRLGIKQFNLNHVCLDATTLVRGDVKVLNYNIRNDYLYSHTHLDGKEQTIPTHLLWCIF